jgi:hypothetical protein
VVEAIWTRVDEISARGNSAQSPACYAGCVVGDYKRIVGSFFGGVGFLRRRACLWSGWTIPAEPALLDISRADSLGHWSVVASASRKAWQGGAFRQPLRRAGDLRGPAATQASDGESRRRSVAFDWQRMVTGGSSHARRFATARDVARERGRLRAPTIHACGSESASRIAARASVPTAAGRLLALRRPGRELAARLRSQGESLRGAGPPGSRERRAGPASISTTHLRQSFAACDLSTESSRCPACVPRRWLGIERYRFDVASSRGLDSGAAEGTLVSPRLDLPPPAAAATSISPASAAGRARPGRGPTVAFDPRDGAPLARLDPGASALISRAGWRSAWRHGLETA